MKAIVYRRYGQPDVLALEELPRPEPGDDEVLIRVHAASVNAWDWDLLRGTPFLNRIQGPLRPRYPILGADVAGTVAAVGRSVTRFRPGDAVYGDLCQSGWGAFAEFVCAREQALAPKPAGLSFAQAAAVPQAASMAVQGLCDRARVQAGHKVLINGAGGGVGTFAVQVAKWCGAEVTGVDRADKLDRVRSLGADHGIDYTREDFTRNAAAYDVILDTAAHRSVFDVRRALRPRGIDVIVGGALSVAFQALLLGPWISLAAGRRIVVLAIRPNAGLDMLGPLLEAGTVAPVIDRRYPLDDVPEAFRYFGSGGVTGKLVIDVAGEA